MSKDGIAKGFKVDAVLRMPLPTDAGTLRSFIGSVQCYAKFLPPYMSTVTEPLHKLTRKGQQWNWVKEEQEAFESLKDLLRTNNVLARYDPSLELDIFCDASKVGIGAVLFHRYSNGSERPIANVLKTLTDMQRRYSQIHKEALAVVFHSRSSINSSMEGTSFWSRTTSPCWHYSDPARRHPF